jgi:chitinase
MSILAAFLLLAVPLQGEPERLVLGYVPSWTSNPAAKDLPLDRLTHVAHAFLQSDGLGRLKPDARLPDAVLARRAREAGVRPLLSLGGAASAPVFRAVVADPEALLRYADAVAAAAAEHGYEGVDIDWEPTENDADKAGLVVLARALRAALEAKGVRNPFLSMAAPSGPWSGRWWDVEALLPHVDLLNVMAYDFHGPWSAHAGHNAPLFAAPDDPGCGPGASAEGAIRYWRVVRRWPAGKLCLGIPCYGRGFAVRRWGQAPRGPLDPPTVDARGLERLRTEGWVRGFDPRLGVPFLLADAGLYSYEDAESAALKGAWARQEGLRGIFFWNLAQDHAESGPVVVPAAARAFLGR